MCKNDLSAFQRKSPSAPVLTVAPKPSQKVGAPKKPKKEKLSQRIQTMLTEVEFEKLEADRGAVPMSAYLRLKLKDLGVI